MAKELFKILIPILDPSISAHAVDPQLPDHDPNPNARGRPPRLPVGLDTKNATGMPLLKTLPWGSSSPCGG